MDTLYLIYYLKYETHLLYFSRLNFIFIYIILKYFI